MRVLQVHNFYRQAGGEDVVAANERALLMDHGHEARLWSVSNDAIKGVWRMFQTAWQAPYSPGAKARFTREIAGFGPDVVHVHNFFPILTPSIYDACADARVPVVQTLHNYRLLCPQALLLRNGKPCEKCVSGSPYHAVLYGCYRGSATKLGFTAILSAGRPPWTNFSLANRVSAMNRLTLSRQVPRCRLALTMRAGTIDTKRDPR